MWIYPFLPSPLMAEEETLPPRSIRLPHLNGSLFHTAFTAVPLKDGGFKREPLELGRAMPSRPRPLLRFHSGACRRMTAKKQPHNSCEAVLHFFAPAVPRKSLSVRGENQADGFFHEGIPSLPQIFHRGAAEDIRLHAHPLDGFPLRRIKP